MNKNDILSIFTGLTMTSNYSDNLYQNKCILYVNNTKSVNKILSIRISLSIYIFFYLRERKKSASTSMVHYLFI